jgi:hypothetical protein
MIGAHFYDTLKNDTEGEYFHFGTNAMPRLRKVLSEDIESQRLGTVTLDWSAFDSRCPKWLLLEVWRVLEDHIDFD